MFAQIYTLKPLPREARTQFELPEDPYADPGEDLELALKYLRDLGVFFYRDEEYHSGVIIDPEIGEEMVDREGFIGYKYLVDLDPDTFKVLEWDDANARRVRERVELHGDNYSWLIWEQERRIRRVTESAIHTS